MSKFTYQIVIFTKPTEGQACGPRQRLDHICQPFTWRQFLRFVICPPHWVTQAMHAIYEQYPDYLADPERPPVKSECNKEEYTEKRAKRERKSTTNGFQCVHNSLESVVWFSFPSICRKKTNAVPPHLDEAEKVRRVIRSSFNSLRPYSEIPLLILQHCSGRGRDR